MVLDRNYHDKIWNNIYRKMAPDDLHTVFCGVLGKHFINILTEVGNQLNMGKDKFLQVNNTLFDAAFGWTGGTERRRDETPPCFWNYHISCVKQSCFSFAADGYSTPRDIPVL
jgi:hypothetical protein